MKDKQVEKLIVDKANLVVVPDVTDKIKARFNEIPPKPETKPVFHPRRLVEIMAFSMVLLIVATLAILYNTRETDPLVSADESLYEAVMLSSISTMSIINENAATIQSDEQVILLAFGPNNNEEEPDEDEEITTNVDGVRHYLKLMESVLASDDAYHYERQIINRRQRRFQLQFRSASLTDEETNYDLSYQVVTDNDTDIILSATITEDDQSYPSDITYNKTTKMITMTTGFADGHRIDIQYHPDDTGTHYQITRYENMTMVEQVDMSYQTRENVTLSFVHGNVFGTYQFSLTIGPFGVRRMLSIDYDIQDTYHGNITISVTGSNDDTYTMVITPHGRPSFIITRDRRNGRN